MVAPGFINVRLSKKFLITQIQQVLEGDLVHSDDKKVILNFLKSPKKQRIMVEFTDPNPFKEMHIGHLYSNIVGESICRLLEATGATVRRVCYQGDVGLHVAKCLYGFMQLSAISYQLSAIKGKLEEFEGKSLEERIKFLGQCYAAGATAYEEDTDAQEEIKRINMLVYIAYQERLKKEKQLKPAIDYRKHLLGGDRDLEEIAFLYDTGRKWSLEYFEHIYKRLDTAGSLQGYTLHNLNKAFDGYYFEGEVGEYGVQIVQEYLKKGVFEESEGAVVFRAEKYGLHTRVFINSLGLPTYETKELGLAPQKYKDWPYDQSIIVTGNEINEYFKVLLAALSQINPELAAKTKHIGHGMVRLPQGKMSSRTGNVLTAEWLLNEAVFMAKDLAMKKGVTENGRVRESHIVGGTDKRGVVNEAVGVGAVKYSLLHSNIGSDITFDFNTSFSLEGNSGPYLQYTYARTQSVLRKSNKKLSNYPIVKLSNIQLNSEELVVLRLLYRFPEVVVEAAATYSPNLVCSYLYDLAGAFNTFYAKHSILSSANENFDASSVSLAKHQNSSSKTQRRSQSEATQNFVGSTAFRLELTQAVGITIKNGLYLLGIQAPERM